MIWLLSILSVSSSLAFGQEFGNAFNTPVFSQAEQVQLKDLEMGNAAAYQPGKFFERSGGRSFGLLKEDLTVRIKPPVMVYSSPGPVRNSDAVKSPQKEMCPYKPGNPDLTGKVLWVSGGVMAVKLDIGPNFCGTQFNSDESVRDIVFVNADHIASLDRTEDLKTEAGLPECNDPACRMQRALNDITAKLYMNDMGVSCEDVADFKGQEQIEAYLACYSTPHQADYDSTYKKLIDLASSKMTISFSSTAEQEKVPQIELLNFTAEEDDPYKGMDRSKLPLLVSPNATVLKCIARRESGWNRNVTSGTGARGIGQQTKVNIADVNDYLANDPAGKAVWTNYFRSAKESFTAAEWTKLTTNTSDPDHPKPCPRTEEEWNRPVKIEDAYCPMTSIASMALYQIMVEFAIRDKNAKYRDHSFNAEEFSTVANLMSISHNAGITAVRRAATGDIKYWVGNLNAQQRSPARTKEVADYGKYMRNCLSGDPERAWKAIEGIADRNCDAFKPPKDCK